MRKFHVINDTNPQEFSKKLEEFCRNKSIYNIAYKTNTIQTVEQIPDYKHDSERGLIIGTSSKEVVKTNYSALIQYQ